MKQQVGVHQLCVGQPLPWDVYAQDGVLLLKRGQIIETQRALERFVEEGLYLQGNDAHDDAPVVDEQKTSAVQHVLNARRGMAHIFERRPEAQDDFVARIERATTSVLAACGAHSRASLSTIVLLQDIQYTTRHVVDTALLAALLAQAMAIDEAGQRTIVAAALTMNFGMYEVQEKVHAIPGPLNEKLRAMIQAHPGIGVERLKKLGISDDTWLQLVSQHHEHHDGSGYPAKLAGDAITLGARILGLADRYTAMVSARGYHGPQKPTAAIRELYIKHGQTIDTTVAGTLIRVLGLYPVGTLVRLVTGEIAVVTGPGEGPDTPEVHAVLTKSGAALDVASHRKTHLSKFAIEEVVNLDTLTRPLRIAALWGKDAAVR